MPRLIVSQRAERDLDGMPDYHREAVEGQIILVGANPTEEGHHLKGTYYCRWSSYTAGNRRIIYRIESGSRDVVIIVAVPHRNTA